MTTQHTTKCPECSSFTTKEKDPNLPESHRNIVCNNMVCPVDLIEEVDIRGENFK